MTATQVQGRAVLYARLSRDQAKTGEGVERQMTDCRELARLRGWTVVAEYVDNDMSAAGKRARPGFDALLEDVRSGTADVVVAWAWDRLSRNRRDQLKLIEVGQEAQAFISLVRGSGDLDMSNANGRFVADMLASISRQEIDAKGERQQRASVERAKAGRPPTRRAFGYEQDGSPNSTEAPMVAEIFTLFLTGSTIVGLKKHLNENGFTTTRGKAWDDSGARVMLRNPRYISERYYRGQRVAAGSWPALVTPETFEAAQAILNDPARRKTRPARRYLGSSLYCCWCGALTKTSYANGGNRVYVCRAKRHMQRNADPVDAVVYELISARLRRPDLLRGLLAGNNDAVAATTLRQEAVGIQARLDALGVDYALGRLTGRQVQVATARLEEDMASIQSQLAEAGKGSALATILGADDPGQAWLDLPLDRQRAVIRDLATVTIMPGAKGRGAFDRTTVNVQWR
jgi:site-specific DNA recombinase